MFVCFNLIRGWHPFGPLEIFAISQGTHGFNFFLCSNICLLCVKSHWFECSNKWPRFTKASASTVFWIWQHSPMPSLWNVSLSTVSGNFWIKKSVHDSILLNQRRLNKGPSIKYVGIFLGFWHQPPLAMSALFHYYGRRLLWTTPDNAFEYLIGSPNLKYEDSKFFSLERCCLKQEAFDAII